jgi:putative MATE family efflux protein
MKFPVHWLGGRVLSPLNRKIVHLALPAMTESMLVTLVQLVDTIMVGWLKNPAALAAVALSSSFYFVLQGVFMALGTGGMALTSRAWGAMRRDEAAAAAAQAIGLALAAGLVLTVGFAFAIEPAFRLLGADDEVVRLGSEYLGVLLLCTPFTLTMIVAATCMRAAGDTVTPMKINLVFNILNMVWDPLLIFGIGPFPALGVAGAAWATVISGTVAVILTAWVLTGRRIALQIDPRRVVVWQASIVRRIVRIATPTLLEIVCQRLGFMVFMGMITSLGTQALAAYTVALRVESLSFNPGWGLSVAAAALVGQHLGAGDPHEAERIARRAALLGVLFMGGCGIIFVLFGRQLVLVFGATPEIIQVAGNLVMIVALAQPAMAIFFVLSGALRGAGDTRSPLFVTLFGTIVMRLGLVWLLGFHFGFGIYGVWWACILDWSGRAGLIFLFFRRGKWKRIEV